MKKMQIRMQLVCLFSMLLLFFPVELFAQQGTITGKVVDERGESVIGATVMVKGSTDGTITDLDGNFKINGKVGTTITVSYVGYAPLEVKITKLTGNRFVMKEDSKTLDEVVVVGMGTQKRNTITAAVATVNADAIATRPVTDVTSALQGNVAGLNFASDASESGTGGEVGGEIKFNIRGIGSINGGEALCIGGWCGTELAECKSCRYRKYQCIERCFCSSRVWCSCCVWCGVSNDQER